MFEIRPRKLDEIKQDTKMVFLVSRGDPRRKTEYVLNNTEFHTVILQNNTSLFRKLLNDTHEKKNINALSLMNTPLLLALKQGNIEIAKLILERAEELSVNINQKDGRGLTALDWACILRENDVIKMLLSLSSLTIHKDSYAQAIYFQPVHKEIFTKFLAEIKKNGIEKEIPEAGYPSLYIFTQEPYSDLIYFMRDVCVNLNIMDAKHFPSSAELSSHVWFYRCFEIGYEAFCKSRNQKPVARELLDAMLSLKSLNDWRKKSVREFS